MQPGSQLTPQPLQIDSAQATPPTIPPIPTTNTALPNPIPAPITALTYPNLPPTTDLAKLVTEQPTTLLSLLPKNDLNQEEAKRVSAFQKVPLNSTEKKARSGSGNLMESISENIKNAALFKQYMCSPTFTPSIIQETVKLQGITPLSLPSNPTLVEHPIKQRKCSNKLCSMQGLSTDIEIGWVRRKLGKQKYQWLCKNCSLAYQLGQYCDYCFQIYLDKTKHNAVVDGREWIQCEWCKKWLHTECEEANRNKDIKISLIDSNFKFLCLKCSEKQHKGLKARKRKKNKLNDIEAKRKHKKTTQSRGRQSKYSFDDCFEYNSGI